MGVEPPWYPETAADGFRAQLLTTLGEEPDYGPDSVELCRSFMNTFLPPEDARGLRRVFLRKNLEGGQAKFQPVDKLTR